jgi:hypothetical protein
MFFATTSAVFFNETIIFFLITNQHQQQYQILANWNFTARTCDTWLYLVYLLRHLKKQQPRFTWDTCEVCSFSRLIMFFNEKNKHDTSAIFVSHEIHLKTCNISMYAIILCNGLFTIPCSAELISTAYQPWNDVFFSQQNSHSRLITECTQVKPINPPEKCTTDSIERMYYTEICSYYIVFYNELLLMWWKQVLEAKWNV